MPGKAAANERSKEAIDNDTDKEVRKKGGRTNVRREHAWRLLEICGGGSMNESPYLEEDGLLQKAKGHNVGRDMMTGCRKLRNCHNFPESDILVRR